MVKNMQVKYATCDRFHPVRGIVTVFETCDLKLLQLCYTTWTHPVTRLMISAYKDYHRTGSGLSVRSFPCINLAFFFLHNRNTWLILINDFINCTQSVMTETISYCLGCCACFVCVCLKLLCNKVRAYTTWVGCLWQTTLDCNYYPNLSNAHKQTCMDRHTLANKQWAQTHMLAPAHGLINQRTHTHIYPASVAAYPRVTAHWEKETLFGFSRAEHITHNRQQWLFL